MFGDDTVTSEASGTSQIAKIDPQGANPPEPKSIHSDIKKGLKDPRVPSFHTPHNVNHGPPLVFWKIKDPHLTIEDLNKKW